MTLPRCVEIIDDKYVWDDIFVDDNMDGSDLDNVFSSKIITSTTYPLIFDEVDKNDYPEAYYRSIHFYKEIIISKYIIPDKYLIYFYIGLRDLFIASKMDLLKPHEIELLKVIIDNTLESQVVAQVDGLYVSAHPTSEYIMARYMNLDIDDSIHNYFIKNSSTGLYLVFVNPADLSYHNFENIINLDNHINYVNDNVITKILKINNMDIYKFQVNKKLCNILLKLDKLGVYSLPLNSNDRGGKRFIFKSQHLSNVLSNSIKNLKI